MRSPWCRAAHPPALVETRVMPLHVGRGRGGGVPGAAGEASWAASPRVGRAVRWWWSSRVPPHARCRVEGSRRRSSREPPGHQVLQASAWPRTTWSRLLVRLRSEPQRGSSRHLRLAPVSALVRRGWWRSRRDGCLPRLVGATSTTVPGAPAGAAPRSGGRVPGSQTGAHPGSAAGVQGRRGDDPGGTARTRGVVGSSEYRPLVGGTVTRRCGHGMVVRGGGRPPGRWVPRPRWCSGVQAARGRLDRRQGRRRPGRSGC